MNQPTHQTPAPASKPVQQIGFPASTLARISEAVANEVVSLGTGSPSDAEHHQQLSHLAQSYIPALCEDLAAYHAFQQLVADTLKTVEARILISPDQDYNEVYEAFRAAASTLGLDLNEQTV